MGIVLRSFSEGIQTFLRGLHHASPSCRVFCDEESRANPLSLQNIQFYMGFYVYFSENNKILICLSFRTPKGCEESLVLDDKIPRFARHDRSSKSGFGPSSATILIYAYKIGLTLLSFGSTPLFLCYLKQFYFFAPKINKGFFQAWKCL